MLLLVTQEPRAPGKREELGTPKAGLSLGTVLLSKCVGFQNPLSVAHAQMRVARGPAVAVRGADQRRREVTMAPALEQEPGAAFQ